MSMTSEQVNTLRNLAKMQDAEYKGRIINRAADTIESLSAKLSAANMEMNDFIKRGDVMDTLEKVFDNYNIAFNEHGEFAQAVPDAIRDIPTAYDVDKVVERIRREVGDCENECAECKRIMDCDACRAERAIEIVKAGMKG